jgi:DUF971 family protein
MMNAVHPTEIHVDSDKRILRVTFDDGDIISLPATLLRTESPSAEVQGHHPSEKKIVAGKENVKIVGIEPQGHCAIKIIFDDGHDTGIYRWQYLKNLAK